MRSAVLCLAMLSCARGSLPPEPACTLETPLSAGVPGSPGHLIASDLNPNGASELATLMRSFVADLRAAREAVSRGQPSQPMWSRHRKMRCAWPTALEDRTPGFDALAMTYLRQVQALETRPADIAVAYNNVVTACRACHDVSCPGPIDLIEGLRLSATQ